MRLMGWMRLVWMMWLMMWLMMWWMVWRMLRALWMGMMRLVVLLSGMVDFLGLRMVLWLGMMNVMDRVRLMCVLWCTLWMRSILLVGRCARCVFLVWRHLGNSLGSEIRE